MSDPEASTLRSDESIQITLAYAYLIALNGAEGDIRAIPWQGGALWEDDSIT
jgi:hypothetical protein